jgi:hypothetical protein
MEIISVYSVNYTTTIFAFDKLQDNIMMHIKIASTLLMEIQMLIKQNL